jgi:uncharacterized protein YegL
MSLDKIPYIQIAQSVNCVPPAEKISISLDMKILPDARSDAQPFYGVWLLDNSGSMDGDRIEKAKQSLCKQVESLPDGTIFNLVTFESEVKDIIKNETISDKTQSKIVGYIKKIEAMGGTALYHALEHAIKMVRNAPRNMPRKIILITDGEPGDVPVEMGNEKDPNYQKYFLLAREALEYKASIDTVGALGEHNVFLLYEIAKQSTGKYIFAQDSEELKEKMLIASEQTTKIVYSQPSLTIKPILGSLKIDDAVQYKPTIIRMPFEKIKENYKAWMRSFEAGDTYQIILKLTIELDKSKIQREGENHILDIEFDFGKKGLQVTKDIKVLFSEDSSKHRVNPQINKQYANLFTQAQEISEQTIKNDASATQRIQGDETKKIKDA